MKTYTGLLAVMLLIITTAIQVRADIARPKPSPVNEPKHVLNTGIQIVPDSNAYGARLQISQATVNELREAMNAGNTTQSSFAARFAGSSTNTIIAGLLLFMSVSLAGVWLARSAGKKAAGQKAVAAVLISVAMLGAAAIISQANAGPPPAYLWRNLPKNLTAGKPTSGGVDIEIVADGVGVKLIVPLKNSDRTTDD